MKYEASEKSTSKVTREKWEKEMEMMKKKKKRKKDEKKKSRRGGERGTD